MSTKIKEEANPKMDLTGQRFGRLLVLKEAPSRRDADNHLRRYWLCQCDCGEIKEISQAMLRKGDTKSCGCYDRERRLEGSKNRITKNKYEIKNDYCIITDISNRSFIIDLEDLEKVKQRYWHVRKDGYVYSRHRGSKELCNSPQIALHEYLIGERYVDHLNKNPSDNRRCNLRTKNNCSGEAKTSNQGFNNFNHKLRKDNKSGITGVRFDNKSKKWQAEIYIDYKYHSLGYFDTKDEAIAMRRLAESYYAGEYSAQNSSDIADRIKIKKED